MTEAHDREAENSSRRWLLCGAVAGLAVDLTLYPLDTVKTRLQSKKGFLAAGGFRSLYSGMGSVAIGSAPGSAIFFLTYQNMNYWMQYNSAFSHAASASCSEMAACLVRVPTELVKQRAQAEATLRISAIARDILTNDGFYGFFRGYGSTIAREIPFSVIQFPIWEALKSAAAKRENKRTCSPLSGAVAGSIAGGIAAALTTPLDMVKTRIMLNKDKHRRGILLTMLQVYREGGIARLFSGVVPRAVSMCWGGFIFFGAFEVAKNLTSGL